MTVIDDYVNFKKKYKLELGDDTVVLMQIGSFFEIYADTKEDKDIHRVANTLNIIVSRKNKKIDQICRKNPLMAGFPMIMLDKYAEMLIKECFSVVVIEQITDPPNPERQITKIWSPGTYPGIVSTNEEANNVLFCHFCNTASTTEPDSYACGIALLDCGTGITYVDEVVRPKMDVLQNLINLGIRYSPKEVIVSYEKGSSSEMVLDIQHLFRNKAKKIHTYAAEQVDLSINRVRYILNSFYTNESQLDIFEYLDMDRMVFAATALSQLLHFTTKHKLSFQKSVRKPEKINKEQNLRVSYNAFDQLNITDGEVTLLSILNRSKTSIGKRYFNFRLLNPFSSAEEILRSYNTIATFSENSGDVESIRNELSEIKDIQKIGLKSQWAPKDIYSFYVSLKALQNIAENHDRLVSNDSAEHWKSLRYIQENFNCDLHSGFFHGNSSLSIDDNVLFKCETKEIHSLRQSLSDLRNVFMERIQELNAEHFKLEHNDREGYYISTTTKRYNTYKENSVLLKKCKTTHSKSGYTKVYIPEEKQLNSNIHELNQQLQNILQSAFQTHVTRIRTMLTENDTLHTYVRMIEHLDFYSTCCVNNVIFQLSQPEIIESGGSYLNARDLRHLLVEHVSKDLAYIPNDISLNSHGVLLYGVNASGKSCFMKSVAIAVIMAQAGMHVAAASFEFNPFKSIYTRITGNDDLFRRQSTFVLEMSELRQILKHGDNTSLIIGDELCSGTETISGISIVTSAIKQLSGKSCCFLFASHLHELTDLIKDTSTKVFHFSVTHENGVMIYERKIRGGSGDTLYGLEVCKSLDMDQDFVENAFKIRQKLLKSDVGPIRKSRYNSEYQYQSCCHLCNSNTDAIEIHHIVEQAKADENGYVGSIHKNDVHNLVALCKACHDKVHAGTINIEGYRMSSKGKILLHHSG